MARRTRPWRRRQIKPRQVAPISTRSSGRGLRNYWGYNTIGFFAPHPEYLGAEGLGGFKGFVQQIHDAGIEVILDVVYNHTAEGNQLGPTLSFRGIDNKSYYFLKPGAERYYSDFTGTGNALEFRHPMCYAW